MSKNKLNVTLRQRNTWEAIDLGFSLVHQNFKALFLPWLIQLAIVFAPLYLFLHKKPELMFCIFVIFLPFFERTCLFVLSRSVFGSAPTTKETLKSWSKQCKNGMIVHTFIHRINPARIFLLPVWQLEQLKGKANSKRRSILSRGSGSSALGCGILFMIFEAFIGAGFFFFLTTFIPEGQFQEYAESFFMTSRLPEHLVTLAFFIYFLTVILLRPFQIACNFSLYLNRRMELEGWDIELHFRSLIERLNLKKAGILLIIGFSLLTNSTYAQEKTETVSTNPKQAIEKVMNKPEFNNKKKIQSIRLKEFFRDLFEGEDEDEEESSGNSGFNFGFGELFAALGKIVILTLLAAVLVYLIMVFIKNYRLAMKNVSIEDDKIKPKTIMGMDMSEESLPENLVEQALKLWQTGEQRTAYSLLYRGALANLVHNFDIELKASYTEGDCVKAAKIIKKGQTHTFFSELTHHWCLFAYGHITPETSQFKKLCGDWRKNFELNTEEANV